MHNFKMYTKKEKIYLALNDGSSAIDYFNYKKIKNSVRKYLHFFSNAPYFAEFVTHAKSWDWKSTLTHKLTLVQAMMIILHFYLKNTVLAGGTTLRFIITVDTILSSTASFISPFFLQVFSPYMSGFELNTTTDSPFHAYCLQMVADSPLFPNILSTFKKNITLWRLRQWRRKIERNQRLLQKSNRCISKSNTLIRHASALCFEITKEQTSEYEQINHQLLTIHRL